jgi:hypothetical protein
VLGYDRSFSETSHQKHETPSPVSFAAPLLSQNALKQHFYAVAQSPFTFWTRTAVTVGLIQRNKLLVYLMYPSLRVGEGMLRNDPSGLCRNRRSDRLDRVGRGGLDPARQVMIRTAEYKDNAQQCRALAKRMLRPEDRDALERIAQIWERLAIVPELHPEPEPEPQPRH